MGSFENTVGTILAKPNLSVDLMAIEVDERRSREGEGDLLGRYSSGDFPVYSSRSSAAIMAFPPSAWA